MKPLALVALYLCGFSLANAAEFQLVDGSIVMGTIVRLENGEDLVVDTEHMGDEVVVNWQSVVRIQSTKIVDVELFDGRRFVGVLHRDNTDIRLEGLATVRLSANDVFHIEQYKETVWEGISADTNLGMNIVRGNSEVTQLSIGAGVGYDDESFEISLRGTTIINEQTDAEDTRRSTLTGSYTHKYSDGWRAIGSLQVEADEQQELDRRTLLSGGFGKRIFNQREHRLELFAGIAVNSERFSGLAQNETLEGLLETRYRMRSFADVDATLLILPNLEEDDRDRVQFDASISFGLYENFDFKITLYDRYDSQPPVGNDKNDSGLTLGLSWSY